MSANPADASLPADPLLARIVAFACEKNARPLTAHEAQAMTMRVMDSLACAIPARRSDAFAALCAMPGATDTKGPCTLIGGGRASLEGAAFLNASLIRQLDWNDTYVGKNGGHPSDFFSGAFAAAEYAGRSGHDALRAIAIGNHLLLDLCDAANAIGRGWDPAVFVAFGASLSIALALDLKPPQIAQALTLTALNAPMLMGRLGKASTWKGVASAYAVRNAMFDALLARAGRTGPDPVFEGEYGFAPRISGPLDLELDAGRDRTGDSSIKFYPAIYHAQGPLELALALHADIAAAPGAREAIESVDIDIYDFALRYTADTPEKWRPLNIETADHSLPFMAAHAILRSAFSPGCLHETLWDEEVRGLAARVRVNADDAFSKAFPAAPSSRITVRAAGRTFTREVNAPLGHSLRPLSPADVRAKFLTAAQTIMSAHKAAQWADRIAGFAQAPRVGPLLDPDGAP
ncbi:MAG: MmgE/PrpD family protein [Beijerinckiaceae bacterium]|nr:MmgE/PrpD family protein [Beijerinckiaceae bacterium]